MILLDFAAGDLQVKDFLGADVLAGFDAAIQQREEAGEHLVTSYALARPVIEDAEYDNGVVRLSVRYSADLVSHISGAGTEENTSSPVRSRDLWTFERHVQSDSPNWLLIATQQNRPFPWRGLTTKSSRRFPARTPSLVARRGTSRTLPRFGARAMLKRAVSAPKTDDPAQPPARKSADPKGVNAAKPATKAPPRPVSKKLPMPDTRLDPNRATAGARHHRD